jgi:hypothetical protein
MGSTARPLPMWIQSRASCRTFSTSNGHDWVVGDKSLPTNKGPGSIWEVEGDYPRSTAQRLVSRAMDAWLLNRNRKKAVGRRQ